MNKIITIFLLVFPAIGFAGNLTGNITDKETGSALEGVNVVIKELQKGCTTDENGNFELKNLSTGKYTVIVSYLGYARQSKKVSLSSSSSHLIFILAKEKKQLDEVVVATSKYAEIRKVPSRINLLQLEKIEASPETRISEILDNISGVTVENTLGVYSSKSTVSLRGLSGNDQSRTLILLDDIPLNKSDGGSVNWNLINKENIEAIKVIKGSGPAKYGSNAMGGVINIITKVPNKEFEGNVKAGYGTYNTFSGNTTLSGKSDIGINKFYWNLAASAMKSDGYVTELEEYIEVADSIIVPVFLEEINTSAKLGYQFNEKHNVEVFANYFNDIRGNGIHVFDDYGAYSEHDTWFSVAKYNYKHKQLAVNAKAFSLNENYQRVYEYMKEGEYMLYDVDSKRNEMGVDAELSLSHKNSKYCVGASYKQGSVDATDTYYTSTDIISNAGQMDIFALFLQDAIDLKQYDIQINLGLRYDYARFSEALFSVKYPSYSIEFMSDFQDSLIAPSFWNALSPKFSVQKHFNESTRIYFSYGKGFKAPLLDDLCRTSKKQGSFKIANPSLQPETVNNFDVGIDYEPFKNFEVKQSVYYTIGNDFMYLISTGDSVNLGYKISPIYTIDNISKVRIYGFENDFDYRINRFVSAYINYTFNVSQIAEHQRNNNESDDDLSNKYLTNIPKHKIAAGLNWKNKIANTSLTAKYIGSRWINDTNEIDDEYLMTDKFPAYVLVNAKLQRELIDNLDLTLSVNNIFNTIFVNNKLQRCPGRTISVEVIYKF